MVAKLPRPKVARIFEAFVWKGSFWGRFRKRGKSYGKTWPCSKNPRPAWSFVRYVRLKYTSDRRQATGINHVRIGLVLAFSDAF